MKKIFFLFCVLYTSVYCFANKHEMRAVWLTTIGGLDWPRTYAQSKRSAQKQQSEFIEILEKLQHAGINTILLQTRVRATTIFKSDMEPWDGCLSGFPGKSPGYDALEFAINECHKRGIQLHAWIVTIPVGRWNDTGCRNLRNRVPALIKKIGDFGYMNPEKEGSGDYIAEFCADITRRYDIDGIHLDYIRYPETWGKITNYDRGREYITSAVRKITKAVKREKPWVMMSCSPIGKYSDLPRQWSHGWNARDIVCQDAALWMNEGLMDALFPMMYFKDNNFYPFAIDWKERSNGRIVAPGLGIYFMSPKEKNWPLIDISREMYVLRQINEGFCFFRCKFLLDNTKGIYDFIQGEFCTYPALTPPMTWYLYKKPEKPAFIKCSYKSNGTGILSWGKGKDNSNGNYLRYNVYASRKYPVDTEDAGNILVAYTTSSELKIIKGYYYAVCSVDRYGNESEPISTTMESTKKNLHNLKIGNHFAKRNHILYANPHEVMH